VIPSATLLISAVTSAGVWLSVLPTQTGSGIPFPDKLIVVGESGAVLTTERLPVKELTVVGAKLT